MWMVMCQKVNRKGGTLHEQIDSVARFLKLQFTEVEKLSEPRVEQGKRFILRQRKKILSKEEYLF